MGDRCAAAVVIRVAVAPGSLATGALVTLDADESHHLQVRRGTDAMPAAAIDGAGAQATGTLTHAATGWQFRVEAVEMAPRPAELWLAVAAGDRDRFLWVVEKAAELGVTRVLPIETTRSLTVATRLREGAIDKARRRAREGCKQSGNPWCPELAPLQPLAGLETLGNAVTWFLAEAGAPPPEPTLMRGPVGWLIGPEGGFDASERRFCVEALAATPVSLGPHVLRFETAAIAAAAVTATIRQAGGEGER